MFLDAVKFLKIKLNISHENNNGHITIISCLLYTF